jgi:hypothetical protein
MASIFHLHTLQKGHTFFLFHYHFFKSFPRGADEEGVGVDVFEEELRGGAAAL